MMNESFDACGAAVHVGYESASQFSREYSRVFGAPPQRDITRMRLAPTSGDAFVPLRPARPIDRILQCTGDGSVVGRGRLLQHDNFMIEDR